MDPHAKHKLGPRYARPFCVLERIGSVAYHLQLLEGARLHDVFHVSLMKKHRGDPPAAPAVLPPTRDGRVLLAPQRVLQVPQRRGVWKVLIKWHGLPDEDATQEHLDEFPSVYLDFQVEDVLFLQAGRDVMTGIPYTRRKPSSG